MARKPGHLSTDQHPSTDNEVGRSRKLALDRELLLKAEGVYRSQDGEILRRELQMMYGMQRVLATLKPSIDADKFQTVNYESSTRVMLTLVLSYEDILRRNLSVEKDQVINQSLSKLDNTTLRIYYEYVNYEHSPSLSFFQGAISGDVDHGEKLLAEFGIEGIDINLPVGPNRLTALHAAAVYGRRGFATFLTGIEGCDPTVRDAHGRTAAEAAIHTNQSEELQRYLVDFECRFIQRQVKP